MNRMSMLKHISFIGKENLNIFNSYIPNHYNEIYALYNLLKDSGVNYDDITFLEPEESDKSFIFNCYMDGDLNESIRKYVEDHPIVTYIRDKSFKVIFKYGKEMTKIKFIEH
jgi:hypothetical protein